jgi:hypothetical protein
VIQDVRLSDCDWLLPNTEAGRDQRANFVEWKKRRELMEEFLVWLVDAVVLELIKVRFFLLVN